MPVRSFTISTDRIGPRRWCWVRIHPDVEHLRDAGHRYRPASRPRAWWDECMGCFQPTCYDRNDTTGEIRYPANGFAGVLRLSAPDITAEIVAHELVHAAASVYRMNVTRTVRLGDGHTGFHREEDFAYIYGELYASFESGWHALDD